MSAQTPAPDETAGGEPAGDQTAARAARDPAVLVGAAMQVLKQRDRGQDEIRALPQVRAILACSDTLRRACILRAAADDCERPATQLLAVIARQRAWLSLEDIKLVLRGLDLCEPDRASLRMDTLIGQVEATWADLHPRTRDLLRERLAQIAAHIPDGVSSARLGKLTGTSVNSPYRLIPANDFVGRALLVAIAGCAEPATTKAAVIELLTSFPENGRPARAWLARAAALRGTLAAPVALAAALVDAVTDPYSALGVDRRDAVHDGVGGENGYLHWDNQAIAGAVPVFAGQVAGAAEDGSALLPRLRGLALTSIAGPRSIRLATASVKAIADAGLPASVPELQRVERGTRHGTLLRQARTAIGKLAAAQGLGREELLERAVEDHGLAPDGTRSIPLADGWTAVLTAVSRGAGIGYRDVDGKARKSLPIPVKAASAEALRQPLRDVKAVRATVANERARFDGLLGAGRTWDLAAWREYYLRHPVTGRLTQDLIWTFTAPSGETVTGIPAGPSAARTRDGGEAAPPADAVVRLWHPVTAGADEVRAWRQFLLDRLVTQPVKQAFREVYVLTPAEEETRDYSNRFAGHVLRQEQARALLKGRGWTARPLAAWDDGIYHGTALREHEPTGIRAEFYFDPADTEDLTGNGAYSYVTSDQVRFYRAGTRLLLSDVPPLVFTETMRDVDLVVGVSSIGADPEWTDRGDRRFGDYWRSYGFGDLGPGAEVRREVLRRLLPMLAIGDRCTLGDRFLHVRGDLREYEIHLGSGNILMSPNDQYLCIVTARSVQAGKVFLPFDDDHTLSVILSKAFLLAADASITNPSIIRQIERA
jgi:hypothetical protein